MLMVILEPDLVLPQVFFHATLEDDAAQRATKDQPVKTGHHPLNLLPVLCDKLFHGVLLFTCFVNSGKSTKILYRERPPLCLRLAALCHWSRILGAPILNVGNGD